MCPDNTDGLFVFDSSGNRLVENRASANFQNGVYVWSNTSGTQVVGNVADRNGADGIRIDNAAAAVTANTADANADYGIQAVAGVADGGGNRARRNGNPAQCVNVACR